jgi:sulfane dehydrogenase subunit SoxC
MTPLPDESESRPALERDAGVSRRAMLAAAAGLVGGAVLASTGGAQKPVAAPPSRPAPVAPPASAPAPGGPARLIGTPTTPVGGRSPFITAGRAPTGETNGASFTPLQELTGTITPADLHFERHHAGVPSIDPARHELMVHGLVDRPMAFTLDDLRRFPSVTRTHFLECSGNGRSAYRTPKGEMSPQMVDGLTSNSEWTGVPLATLLTQVGVHDDAAWCLAEGGDACLLARSVPLTKAYDDALVVYAQNGEPIRPENGFPMRLLLPGWEGNMNVKWLRRIELGREPWMTRWETSKYTDPLPNDTARLFSFELDAKSIITSPAFPAKLSGPGWWPIRGLAWSGRGTITRVEVSTDGGRRWTNAELRRPVLTRAHTRFELPWKWDGSEAVIMSRATDETGYVQPTRQQLVSVRGPGTDYHFNEIRGWRIRADGSVLYEAGAVAAGGGK